MNDTMITIPTDMDTARRYKAASHEEQYKIQILLRLLLLKNASQPQLTLQQIMDMMSIEAQANGLTFAVLDEILSDNA